jgi:hypothetical protein
MKEMIKNHKNQVSTWKYIGFTTSMKDILEIAQELPKSFLDEIGNKYEDCKFKFTSSMYLNPISGIESSKLCIKSHRDSNPNEIIIYFDPGLLLSYLEKDNISGLSREYEKKITNREKMPIKITKKITFKRLNDYDYHFLRTELIIDDESEFTKEKEYYDNAIVLIPETVSRLKILCRMIIEKQLGSYKEFDKYAP